MGSSQIKVCGVGIYFLKEWAKSEYIQVLVIKDLVG